MARSDQDWQVCSSKPLPTRCATRLIRHRPILPVGTTTRYRPHSTRGSRTKSSNLESGLSRPAKLGESWLTAGYVAKRRMSWTKTSRDAKRHRNSRIRLPRLSALLQSWAVSTSRHPNCQTMMTRTLTTTFDILLDQKSDRKANTGCISLSANWFRGLAQQLSC